MNRTVPEMQRSTDSSATSPSEPRGEEPKKPQVPATRNNLEFWIIRASILVCSAALSYELTPFGLRGLAAAGVGLVLAAIILLTELRLRRVGIGGLLGGALGVAWGVFSALVVTLIISRSSESDPTKTFLEYGALCAFVYLGLALGSEKGDTLNDAYFSRAPSGRTVAAESIKLLDTSVLIDGRIADVCEAHFLDGVLGVPQFVLHELQLVADSSDLLKRQRGRRGLEVLERMQKMPHADLRVLDRDLPQSGDVDHKLVELAQRLGAKIVTNDYNLNKVATVQGLAVLNVNQLANALKPVVMPGEPMRVLILREGKEPNQGVAFLDDGTMVVVDGARRLINKSVNIQVTSVHQSTAGKMIFGRLEERPEQAATIAPQAAAVGAAGRGENSVSASADFDGRAENEPRLPEASQAQRKQKPILP
ncbi:MAG: PIN/TRAM domain-containing protein [Candidatus Acidiferrum sp.]